jgi:hypothetical protein
VRVMRRRNLMTQEQLHKAAGISPQNTGQHRNETDHGATLLHHSQTRGSAGRRALPARRPRVAPAAIAGSLRRATATIDATGLASWPPPTPYPRASPPMIYAASRFSLARTRLRPTAAGAWEVGWGSTRSCAPASSTTAREPSNASWLGQRFLSPGPRGPKHRKAVRACAVQTHTSNVRSHGAAFPEPPPLHAPKRGGGGIAGARITHLANSRIPLAAPGGTRALRTARRPATSNPLSPICGTGGPTPARRWTPGRDGPT